MGYRSDILKVRERLSEAAILEQMAEECTELAQALLKKARKLRNENYTPKTLDEITASINEEMADVSLCATVLEMHPDYFIKTEKLQRWVSRLEGTSDE